MPQYSELQNGSYYLIRHDKETDIELVHVLMETEKTVLLRSFLPEEEDFFMHKEDDFFEVTEELDETSMAQFFNIYSDEDDDEDDAMEYFEENLFEEDDFEHDEFSADAPAADIDEPQS